MSFHKETVRANEVLNAYNIRNRITFDNLNLDGQNHNILDFGCGYGTPTHILAESIPHIDIIGYDISSERVDKAKRLYWSKHMDNINFTSSAEEVNKNSPYNNIISSFVLEHSGTEVLIYFKDLLKIGGKLIIFFYDIKGKDIGNFGFYTGEEQNTIKNIGLEESLRIWSKNGVSDYIKSVQDAGFSVLKTKKFPRSKGKYSYLVAQKKN